MPMHPRTIALWICMAAAGAQGHSAAAADGTQAPPATAQVKAGAESGTAEEQLALALAYEDGQGTNRNPEAAALLFQRAASKGSATALFELGVLSEMGNGIAQDYGAARGYYQQAIGLGVVAAKLRLAMLDLEGWGGPRDPETAFSLVRQAAEEGDRPAQKVLGDMYFSGIGVKTDLQLALRWKEQGSLADDPEAESAVGAIMSKLNAQDAQVAREWYQLSAEQSYTRGMLGMASTFLRPGANPEQIEMGRKWLELAAEDNDGAAEFYLAGLYLEIPAYATQSGSVTKAQSLLERSFKAGQFVAGEVLELSSSGKPLAAGWTYVQSVPMEQRYVERFADRIAEAERNPAATHPPYPIKMVRPVYPASLRLTGIEGDATVDFVVDPTGRVRNPGVVESTHPGFSASAVAAVEAWRFIPASKNGHLVFTHMRVPVHFRLTNIRESPSDDPPNAGPGQGAPDGDRAARKDLAPPEPAAAVPKP